MAQQYTYCYARIDETGFCYEVFSATNTTSEADCVEIPAYSEEYLFKYYINGAWYMDAGGTIPWSPAE